MTGRALRYGSVCSGMEAATSSWHTLGWQPQFFSEIDATASRFLAAKYPDVPNHGDMTKFKDWPDHAIDLLVGGTPCQSFSVAGLRKGLADPRGNLMLTYLAIADRYRPRWLVWENVPGVFSSTSHDAPDPCPPDYDLEVGCDGEEVEIEDEYESEEVHAFNSFVAGLSELGYGWSFVVRDAQYVRVESHPRAVPQRRRRVIVVGHLGDWRRAAAVLFERESLSGHSPPRRKAGQGSARGVEIGPRSDRLSDVNPTLDARAKDGPIRNQIAGAVMCAEVAPTLNAHFGDKQGLEDQHIRGGGAYSLPPVSMCLNAGAMGRIDAESETLIPTTGGGFDVAHPLLSKSNSSHAADMDTYIPEVAGTMKAMKDSGGFSNSADHAAAGYMVPVHAFPERMSGTQVAATAELSPSLGASNPTAIAFDTTQVTSPGNYSSPQPDGPCHPLAAGAHPPALATQYAVRRLTPLECTRLMGFADDYFDCGLNKPISDGAKYKLLGNSKANNVVRWIGERIVAVEEITTLPVPVSTHEQEVA